MTEKTSNRHTDLKGLRVIDTTKLTDEAGQPISFETWLARNASKIAGRPVAYMDRQSPFIFPHVSMTDAERAEVLERLKVGIDSFYDEFAPAADGAPGVVERKQPESMFTKLAHVGRYAMNVFREANP